MATTIVPIAATTSRTPAKAMLTVGGITQILPWWPATIAVSGLQAVWTDQIRPGRSPLVLRASEGIAEWRLTMIVSWQSVDGLSNSSVETSCQNVLDTLQRITNHAQPATLTLGSRVAGKFRITDFSYTELEWTSTGLVSIAEVSLVMRSASDASVPIGPVPKRAKATHPRRRTRA